MRRTNRMLIASHRAFPEAVLDKLGSSSTARLFAARYGAVWDCTFGGMGLKASSTCQATALASEPGLFEGTFKVPNEMCTVEQGPATAGTEGEAPPTLSCSAVTALFDELSTVAICMEDRYHRPGVSVEMNCELLRSVPADTRLTFSSRCVKVGSILGFASTKLFTESGHMVARGRHVKYLPTGLAWNLTFNPIFKPFAVRAMDAQLVRRREKLAPLAEKIEGLPLVDLFPFHPGVTKHSAEMDIQPYHMNFFGSMHGGAVMVAAEKLAREQAPHPGACVSHMSGHYMFPGISRCELEATTTEGAGEKGGLGGGGASTEVKFTSSGRPSAWVRLQWTPPPR